MLSHVCAGRGEDEKRCSLDRSFHLLQLKDVLVEVMLKSLVGEVDAELFEAVVLKVFEAEDVEDADGQDLGKKPGLDEVFSFSLKYS